MRVGSKQAERSARAISTARNLCSSVRRRSGMRINVHAAGLAGAAAVTALASDATFAT